MHKWPARCEFSTQLSQYRNKSERTDGPSPWWNHNWMSTHPFRWHFCKPPTKKYIPSIIAGNHFFWSWKNVRNIALMRNFLSFIMVFANSSLAVFVWKLSDPVVISLFTVYWAPFIFLAIFEAALCVSVLLF